MQKTPITTAGLMTYMANRFADQDPSKSEDIYNKSSADFARDDALNKLDEWFKSALKSFKSQGQSASQETKHQNQLLCNVTNKQEVDQTATNQVSN